MTELGLNKQEKSNRKSTSRFELKNTKSKHVIRIYLRYRNI